jgi:hypothetical protein
MYKVHGVKPQSGYKAWSNDGPLVRYNANEECPNCDSLGPAQSLRQFEAAKFSSTYRLLWRPAYNFFDRDPHKTPGKVTYIKSSPTKDGINSGIDPTERDCLVAFLL